MVYNVKGIGTYRCLFIVRKSFKIDKTMQYFKQYCALCMYKLKIIPTSVRSSGGNKT